MPATKKADFTVKSNDIAAIIPKLRKQMIATGVDVAEVDEIIDLSVHAAEEGFTAMRRVMFGASEPLMIFTISSLTAMFMAYNLDAMREMTERLARELGIGGDKLIVEMPRERARQKA